MFFLGMERSRGIESLRMSGKVAENEIFCHDDIHMPVKTIIQNLIRTSPIERPTASQLLNSVFTEVNFERTKCAEEIECLKNTVTSQQEKIQTQEQLISDQQKEIKRLIEMLDCK